MAGVNSLNRLKNTNLSSVKETAKKTAVLTLLLSTVACNIGNVVGNDTWVYALCCVPLLIITVVGSVNSYMNAKYGREHPEKAWHETTINEGRN